MFINTFLRNVKKTIITNDNKGEILKSIILAVPAVRALWQSQCGARWESRAASRGELTGTTSMSLSGEYDCNNYDRI